MSPERMLLFLGLVALCFLAATIVSASRPESVRAAANFLVGGSAVLENVQIAKVHLFTIAVVVYVLTTPREERTLRYGRGALILVAVLPLAATAYFGDLVNHSLLGLQLLALAGSAVLLSITVRPSDVRPLMLGALTMVSISSAMGLLQFTHLLPGGLIHRDVSALGRPSGFYSEPDWLGLFAGIGIILAVRLRLKDVTAVVVFGILGGAFLLSFARAAWVALAVSSVIAACVGLMRSKQGGGRARRRVVAAGLVLAAIPVVAAPALRTDLVRRVTRTTSVQSQDISAQARVRQTSTLLTLAESAPWYGHGLSASGRVRAFGGVDTGEAINNVATNWVLGWWVDGKYLAVPTIVAFVGLALLRIRRVAGQLLLMVLVSSLFSNALLFPISWFCLGLALTYFDLEPSASKSAAPRARETRDNFAAPNSSFVAAMP